jgi:CubicO group peptidase (beta-lactamase class C family)
MKLFACIFLFIILTSNSFAQMDAAEKQPSSKGFRNNEMTVRTVGILPSKNPLPLKDSTSSFETTIYHGALKNYLNLEKDIQYIILSKGDDILFRQNRLPYEPTPLGYSMSKSLVALTIGKALCDGKIKSLNDKAGIYAPKLENTSWGNASIKDLLEMKSGAFDTDFNFGWRADKWKEVHENNYFSNSYTLDYYKQMQKYDAKSYQSGKENKYSNFDTIALSLILENIAPEGFAKYFEEKVWQAANTKINGAWIITKNSKQILAHTAFSATPDDWIRIANYVLNERELDTCFGNFVKEATTEQTKADRLTKSYGWQIWTNCVGGTDFYCFIGAYGQILFSSPRTKLIMYTHSYDFLAVSGASYFGSVAGISSLLKKIYENEIAKE